MTAARRAHHKIFGTSPIRTDDAVMFALAHLSDLHLSARPRPLDLLGKRGLGFINWHRGRKHVFRSEVLDAIARDLKSLDVDHTAVTGDLVNFSVTAEDGRARAWLETLGPPADVTVIPGNHDIYVPQARRWPAEFWGPYMQGDDGASPGTFPFLRRRGEIVLIALSSALPTAPFSATGQLGDQQLSALGRSTRPKPRPVPGRPCPSPTAEPAEPAHATSHRRRRVSSRTGGKRRRTCSPWS